MTIFYQTSLKRLFDRWEQLHLEKRTQQSRKEIHTNSQKSSFDVAAISTRLELLVQSHAPISRTSCASP
jgi:uncharacterized protein (UPF0335 family)